MFLNENLVSKFKLNFEKEKKEFKKIIKTKKESKIKNEFKRLINLIYKKDAKDIGDELLSVFEIVRLVIIVGIPFCVQPTLGLITWIVDRLISEKVNEKYEGTVLKKFDSEINRIEEKIKSNKISEEEKKELEILKKSLKTKRDTAEGYFNNIKQYKYKDDISKSDDDFNF